MGRRTTKTKPSGPWPLIILFMLPLALLAGLMILINSMPDTSAAERRDQLRRKQAVSDAVTAAGAEFHSTSPGTHVVTLPSAQAMSITPIQAREIALTTQSRLGGRVRVETPAGQILAEAP